MTHDEIVHLLVDISDQEGQGLMGLVHVLGGHRGAGGNERSCSSRARSVYAEL